MKEVRVYENNGGEISAIVFDVNKVVNILSGFEGTLTHEAFVAAVREGSDGSDSYDPANKSGLEMAEAAEEIEDNDDLIATITPEHIEIEYANMGAAGEKLLGNRRWYAVMRDTDDTDWGTGSFDYAEAVKMVQDWRADGDADAYIAVIEVGLDGEDGTCVDEIHDDFGEAE